MFFRTSAIIQESVNSDCLVMEHYFVFLPSSIVPIVTIVSIVSIISTVSINNFNCVNYIDIVKMSIVQLIISRWNYICFYFSSFNWLNRQSLLWKLDLNSLFDIFGLEFHSFEWELSLDLVLNCWLFCFTLLAAVSPTSNRISKLYIQ